MAVLGITYLIVVIQLAIVFFFGGETASFLTTDSWGMVAPAIVMILFAALVAPDAIVRDQKDGMYSLYMSTPLTKSTYLAAKTLSVAGQFCSLPRSSSTLPFRKNDQRVRPKWHRGMV